MGNIVVGMDRSEHAAEALRWAVDEGKRRGWPVTPLLAWTFLAQPHVDPAVDFSPDYSDESAAVALEAYVDAAVGPEVASTLHLETVCDLPADGLLEAAEDASLLVLGPRGLGGFRGLLLGSVSQKCLHRATCPVVIVRKSPVSESDVPPTIVVGVDSSDASRAALEWAVDEARSRQCRVEVVHSWLFPYAYGLTVAVPMDPEPYETGAAQMVARLIESVDTSGLTEPVVPMIVSFTSVSEAILARARTAELVVVGSRGTGALAGMLLGSVAHQVATHAPCPVVVVPSGR